MTPTHDADDVALMLKLDDFRCADNAIPRRPGLLPAGRSRALCAAPSTSSYTSFAHPASRMTATPRAKNIFDPVGAPTLRSVKSTPQSPRCAAICCRAYPRRPFYRGAGHGAVFANPPVVSHILRSAVLFIVASPLSALGLFVLAHRMYTDFFLLRWTNRAVLLRALHLGDATLCTLPTPRAFFRLALEATQSPFPLGAPTTTFSSIICSPSTLLLPTTHAARRPLRVRPSVRRHRASHPTSFSLWANVVKDS
ncbi:hypothetical protein MSAN_00964700 [Mycena sanguinolenta]|uniref:Uncharacterized protein n=1 Tax=Mycena sanguinolenta TaxID=230812 RepID=A0A8H6Z0C5_9AGAR|nr:hypothetical protein MSAN_00964700 [Mycena sanguinolenta]